MPTSTAPLAPGLEAPHRLLKQVLIAKIAITALLWAMPFLLFPPRVLGALMGPVPEPILFLRLLGWAYVALIVGYAAGLVELRDGRTPWATIAMGLVSNGGAAIGLGFYLIANGWGDGVGALLNVASWLALVAITSGLVVGTARARERKPGSPREGN